MPKKLYTVTIKHEVIVIADNEADALFETEESLRRGDLDFGSDDMTAHPMSYLTPEWSLDCIPFGECVGEKTIGDWIREGAAPEYVKASFRSRTYKLESTLRRLKEEESILADVTKVAKFYNSSEEDVLTLWSRLVKEGILVKRGDLYVRTSKNNR